MYFGMGDIGWLVRSPCNAESKGSILLIRITFTDHAW